MMHSFQIRIYRSRELCHVLQLNGDLQIGRQRPGEPGPFHYAPSQNRLIVAPVDDKLVSREHLLLTAVDSSETSAKPPRLRISNQSRKRSVWLDGHGKLSPGVFAEVPPPVLVTFEDFAIRVEEAGSEVGKIRSLEHQTLAPGHTGHDGQASLISQRTFLQATRREEYSREKLQHWLSEMMTVLHSASGAPDFLSQAVEAVDRVVGLDAVSALRYEQGTWRVAVARQRDAGPVAPNAHAPSHSILQRVLDQKRTVYQLPVGLQDVASLQGVKAIVASPILNAEGQLVGALYGVRYSRPETELPQISELEATLVEVIACGAAAGIARELQQQKALQARLQFEQFFTPQLVRELESNPRLLEGHEAHISVLFCDIVGFSAISQRIGSRRTMEWICDVMDHLSNAVLEREGVVVDYLGDELMAMWGAPKTQADHALQAAWTAEDLLRCRPAIDERWLSVTGVPLDFRIGICTGIASVGNTGSTRRLKYGPLGNTVNLASRLQNAAKQFGVRQLISNSTAEAIGDLRGLQLRPLGTTRFVNIPTPVEVFELGLEADTQFGRLARIFGNALRLLQDGALAAAHEALEAVRQEYPQDRPTAILCQRLRSGDAEAVDPDCIWSFDTK